MRITQTMIQNTVLADLNRTRSRLAGLQEQATSGLRVNRPSDDPAAAARAAQLRSSLDAVAELERSVGAADIRLSATESALQRTTDVLVRARELALQGANDTQDADSRLILAAEVASLHDELVAIGNTEIEGSSIFAGYASDAPAFATSGPFALPPAPTTTFTGDSNEIELEVESGVRVAVTLDGRRVFQGDADGNGSPDAGREDLFDTLAGLWEALQANDRTAIAGTLDRLDAGLSQIEVERARTGARLGRVESARSELARREVDLRTRLSDAQDADSIAVFSELVAVETALTAALESAASLIQPTLLDFLG